MEESLTDDQCAVLATLLELAPDAEMILSAGLVWSRWKASGRREQAFLIPLRVKQIEERLFELSALDLLTPLPKGWRFTSEEARHRAASLLGQGAVVPGRRSRVSPLAERGLGRLQVGR